MIEFWKSLTYTTKFSTIGFLISAGLGLLSMGALGMILYYPVSFLFSSYPSMNEWHGDWVWPATIVVGMAWSLGFVFAGFVWYYLHLSISSIIILRIVYVIILWAWAAVLWGLVLRSNLDGLMN